MIKIVEVKELYRDWGKELCVVLDLPPGGDQVKDHCFYELSEVRHYGGKEYQLAVGKNGPFLYHGFFSRTHPKAVIKRLSFIMDILEFEDGYPTPYIMAKTAEGIIPLWLGIQSTYKDVDESKYVEINYHTTRSGNLYTIKMLASVLEEELRKRNMNWELLNTPYGYLAKVINKKPYEVSRRIYLNAENKTTYGAILVWSPDNFAKHEEIFFGAGWPTKEAAEEAINHFVKTGKKIISP